MSEIDGMKSTQAGWKYVKSFFRWLMLLVTQAWLMNLWAKYVMPEVY